MSEPGILDSSDIRHGSKVGRFVVEGQLGAGGMGVVYAAHDRELDRRVALKVLKGTVDEELRMRLMREGQAMARVTHENVITVHEVGMQGSLVFLAQELLDGGTLREWLEAKHTQSEILAKFAAAGRGLAAAHRAGLVHRDFKPDNVLLGKDGRVRVSDFGLARSVNSAGQALAETAPRGRASQELTSPMVTMTRTGAVMGTPLYMSPEQHAGEPADARSDQFSFCVALYEALYGGVPFPGKTAVALADAVMSGRMQAPPKNAPAVPPRIRKILLRGLATKPEERYPTMDALLADLANDPASKRRRIVLVAGIMILIAGAVVGGYVLSNERAARQHQVPARRTIAVLGFSNTAGDKSIDWVSQGLSQFLAAQLVADDVMVTPAEEALRARADLALPKADEFGKDTLQKIRDRLGADAVVTGSYVQSGADLTLIAVVQDIALGKTTRVQVTGPAGDLPGLAAKAGTEIRQALGVSSVAIVKNNYELLPHDATAVRAYIEGMQSLRTFDYRSAKQHLIDATKAEPDFAPGHLALAQAYAGLFDADASKASAKQALATAKTLAVDKQLLVARDAYIVLGDEAQAREQAGRLFEMHKDSLDDGLALAQLQEPDDAVATLATLRKLAPPAGDDPRIDLTEGRTELERQNATRALELARHAADGGTARNAGSVVAEAHELEGEILVATGELAGAQDAFEDARKRFEASHDLMRKLQTMDSLADLALERGQLGAAFKSFDLLATLREQAGQPGVAARASAGAAYALALAGKNSDAEKRLAHAEKLVSDDPIAIPMIDLVAGVLAWAKGDSHAALDRLDKCNARFAQVLPARSVLCLLLRGEIQADLGQTADARKAFEEAKSVADKHGNVQRSATAELELARLDLDDEDGSATVADKIVDRATNIQVAAASHGVSNLEARAAITLAVAKLAQANSQDALDAVKHVGKQEELRIEFERLETQALAESALDDASAGDTLQAVKKIADKQGCIALQIEAHLALAQILLSSKDAAEQAKGKTELAAVQAEAKDKNLGRIVKRADILSRQ